jgi:hypothetical protein
MIRFAYVALLGAALSACNSAPKSLIAVADQNPTHVSSLKPLNLFATAGQQDIQEPSDWRTLNEAVSPVGGKNAE